MRSWHRLALAGVIRQPVMDSTGALQGPLAANSLRTADDRLDKLADDFVEHCSTGWETGK